MVTPTTTTTTTTARNTPCRWMLMPSDRAQHPPPTTHHTHTHTHRNTDTQKHRHTDTDTQRHRDHPYLQLLRGRMGSGCGSAVQTPASRRCCGVHAPSECDDVIRRAHVSRKQSSTERSLTDGLLPRAASQQEGGDRVVRLAISIIAHSHTSNRLASRSTIAPVSGSRGVSAPSSHATRTFGTDSPGGVGWVWNEASRGSVACGGCVRVINIAWRARQQK